MYGAVLPFKAGLNIIRAANSMGKSTAMQGVIYGLGVEAILSTSQGVPFAHVMTHKLHTGHGEIPVLESSVLLEFENEVGIVWTAERTVVGTRHKNLVVLHYGPLLTEGVTSGKEELFVRQPGAARSELGYHKRLAEFLGWELPVVETYDSQPVPLYIEVIFPLMFVEQKRGWSDIQARFPTQFRIKEVAQRATEFLLRLDAYAISAQRRAVQERTLALIERWKARVEECLSLAGTLEAKLEGVLNYPLADWPPAGGVRVLVFRDSAWIAFSEAQQKDRESLEHEMQIPLGTSGQDDASIRQQLEEVEQTLVEKQFATGRTLEEMERYEGEVKAVQQRVAQIEEDLRRNRDELILRRLGASRNLRIADSHCPTCHQQIPDNLVSDLQAEFMTVEDNIAFLSEQRDMFLAVQGKTRREVSSRQLELSALRSEIERLRGSARAMRETLTAAHGTPSIAQIERRVRLQETLATRSRLGARLEDIIGSFASLADEWRENEEARASLPTGGLSDGDANKLDRLEQLLRQQAKEYGMSSIETNALSIDRDTYKPMHEGFVLSFDLSASDLIRTIWAYENGLLEVAREFASNHLNILMLDEPKQQDAAAESLAAFLRRVANSKEASQQVIVATSEPRKSIEEMITGLDVNLLSFSGRIVTKLA
jgi:hypothetical protein